MSIKLFCECVMWCRTDGMRTNHHPNCSKFNDSLIDVWRISYNGQSCVQDFEPIAEDFTDGESIIKEKMHKEIFENLPEFQGF